MDISLSEFQTRFEDVAAGERQEDVVVSVAGGARQGRGRGGARIGIGGEGQGHGGVGSGLGGERQGVEAVLLDTGAVTSVLIGAYRV